MTNSYVSWKGWQGADFGSFTQEHALYYSEELKKSGVNSIAGLRVGELGYGNGGFAGWVRQKGGEWVGHEAIAMLQKRAVQAGYEVVSNSGNFSEAYGRETFDLIVAFDVVEHLDINAIRSFLAEGKDALKPGGLILFRVPSGDSPFSGAIYFGDLTHLTLLGSSAVRQLADDVSLEVIQIRSPALPISGLGPLRTARRLVIHIVQAIVFAFVRYFLMSHSSAVVSPNMMVVLRKDRASN